MWKEIKIDDNIGLQEYVDVWNNREDCILEMSTDKLKNILQKKKDAHCYIFTGIYLKIIMVFKYDASDDTTYIVFQNSNRYVADYANNEWAKEGWDIYRDFIKMLLEKYNRPVKLIKWAKKDRIQIVIDMIPQMYAQWGIKATNLENYWLLELM